MLLLSFVLVLFKPASPVILCTGSVMLYIKPGLESLFSKKKKNQSRDLPFTRASYFATKQALLLSSFNSITYCL